MFCRVGFRDDRGQSDGWDRDRDGSSNRDRYRQSSPEPHRRNDESRNIMFKRLPFTKRF